MDNSSIEKKTKQSLLWFTILPFAVHFIRFAGSIALARLLAPEIFGIVSIVTILFFYSNTFTDFGMANAVVQRKSVEPVHYGTVLVFNLSVSVVLFGLFQVIADDIAVYYSAPILEPVLKVFSTVFIISSFLTGPQAYLKRNVQFKIIAIIEAIRTLVSIAVSLLLAIEGYGIWAIVISMLLSQVLGVALFLYFSKIKILFTCSVKAFRELFSFSMWSFFNVQITLISNNVDKLIIGKSLDVHSLGIFDKAVGFAKMPDEQLSGRISSVSFSTFSRTKDNLEEARYYFRRILNVTSLIVFPVFIGLNLISSDFTTFFLGDKWLEMIPILEIIAIALLVNSLLRPVAAFNMAVGKIKAQVMFNFVATVMLIVTLLEVAQLGLEPVSLTLVGFYLVSLFIAIPLANSVLKINLLGIISWFIAPILASLVMVLAVKYFQQQFVDLTAGSRLIFSIVIGGVSYALCVLAFPFKQWNFVRTSFYGKTKSLYRLALRR